MQIHATSQSNCLIVEGGRAKSGDVAKQKSVGNVGKLTQVSLLHSAPLSTLGRMWQLQL